MKLSDQAMGSLMMVLQQCLMEQTDIVPMLKELDFVPAGNELEVENPPTLHFTEQAVEHKSPDNGV